MTEVPIVRGEPEFATDPAQPPRVGARAARTPSAVGRAGRSVRIAFGAGTKRAFDVLVASLLLFVLAPLLLVIVALVRLDSPGPCFFRCDRVGYRGRPLRMLKFRKMRLDAGGLPLTTADDERFTRIGRWLTKYKLDELPQLWHVLTGEMSLVGPRPESREFVDRYAEDYYRHILTVRPGMVGFTQLAFVDENRILRSDDPLGDYLTRLLPQKVHLDRMYAAKRGLWLDTRILFWASVTVLLRQPIAVNRKSAAMNIRRRRSSGEAKLGPS